MTTAAISPHPETEQTHAVLAPRAPINTLSAIAVALAFVTAIGGIVCGHVAVSQIRHSGERGLSLAIAALVIGYGSVALTVVLGGATLAASLIQRVL